MSLVLIKIGVRSIVSNAACCHVKRTRVSVSRRGAELSRRPASARAQSAGAGRRGGAGWRPGAAGGGRLQPGRDASQLPPALSRTYSGGYVRTLTPCRLPRSHSANYFEITFNVVGAHRR